MSPTTRSAPASSPNAARYIVQCGRDRSWAVCDTTWLDCFGHYLVVGSFGRLADAERCAARRNAR